MVEGLLNLDQKSTPYIHVYSPTINQSLSPEYTPSPHPYDANKPSVMHGTK